MKYLFLLFVIFFGANSLAQENLPSSNSCEQLTGTWYGTYYDEGKLFYNGGPWAIIMNINAKGQRFAGHVISTENIPPKNSFILGSCSGDKLTSIYFLNSLNSCASASEGQITSQQMDIKYQWQNPAGMGSTVFALHLQKAGAENELTLPNFVQAYLDGKSIAIKPCR